MKIEELGRKARIADAFLTRLAIAKEEETDGNA